MISFRKIKVYTQLTGIVLVLILVLMFVFSNREPISVDFLVWTSPEIPKFWFLISVATGGVLVYRITAGVRKVIKDFRQIRREDKSLSQLMDQDKISETN